MSTPFTQLVEPLSDTERAELAALDIAIKDGLRSWLSVGEQVGAHLLRVRDARLYRESHATFEDYCRKQHSLSRKRAYDLVVFAEVREMSPKGDIGPPATERVARELAPLRKDPDLMREVWAEAVELHGPALTATQLRDVVRGPVLDPPAPPPRKDMRFENIADAVAMLQDLPDVDAILWPVDEQGDVEMVDEALAWLNEWLPRARSSWKRHKAAMKSAAA